MIVGFTGTRQGMTPQQRQTFRHVILDKHTSMFVHGDCFGADAEAHALVHQLGIAIEIRPCDFPNSRAHCEGATYVHPTTSAFARNRAIVDGCRILVATPATAEEQPKGGTWYTIRYARKVGRPTIIIHPDGSRVLS